MRQEKHGIAATCKRTRDRSAVRPRHPYSSDEAYPLWLSRYHWAYSDYGRRHYYCRSLLMIGKRTIRIEEDAMYMYYIKIPENEHMSFSQLLKYNDNDIQTIFRAKTTKLALFPRICIAFQVLLRLLAPCLRPFSRFIRKT